MSWDRQLLAAVLIIVAVVEAYAHIEAHIELGCVTSLHELLTCPEHP